jgi:hypothetical protein
VTPPRFPWRTGGCWDGRWHSWTRTTPCEHRRLAVHARPRGDRRLGCAGPLPAHPGMGAPAAGRPAGGRARSRPASPARPRRRSGLRQARRGTLPARAGRCRGPGGGGAASARGAGANRRACRRPSGGPSRPTARTGTARTPTRRRAVAAGVLAGAVLLAATVIMLRGAVGAREAGQPVTGAGTGAMASNDPSSLEFFQRRVREHLGQTSCPPVWSSSWPQ